jgi:outer membrane protein, multidrug efflux system
MMFSKNGYITKFPMFVSAGFIILIMLLIGTGCKVGPDYQKPEIKTPDRFKTASQNVQVEITGDLSKWWTNLDDHVLNELVHNVIQSNLDIKMAGDRIEQAQAVRTIISGTDNPQLNLQGSALRDSYSLNSLFGPFLPNRQINDYTGGFGARWELDLFGKTARNLEAANAGIEAARENQRAVTVAMSAYVAKGYITLRLIQNQLEIAQTNIRIQQETFDIIQQRFKAGLVNDLVVQQAKAQLEAAGSIIPKLDTSLHQAIHKISILTGQEPKALEEKLIKTGDIPATKPVVPVGLPSELLTRRPDVRRAERSLAAATANIGVATADLFPRFSLTGSLGQESISSNNFTDSASRTWTLASGFSWPILDWGMIRGNIKLQTARQQEAMNVYQKSVLTALEDVENALVAYGNEQLRLALLDAQMTASQKSLEIAQQRYDKGLVDYLNVLDVQRQLCQSQDALIACRGQLAISLVMLYESLGGGWESQQ